MKRFERLRRSEAGFTLIELLVVVAIIALLATLALPRVFEAINTTKRDATKGEMATISGALARYYLEYNKYPLQLSELTEVGYLKAGTTFKNKFDNYYMYAVDNGDKATAFVLADPGNKPKKNADGTDNYTLCKDKSETNKAPIGVDPTKAADPTTRTVIYWKSAPTAEAAGGSGFDAQALTLVEGASCATPIDETTVDSLDSWTAVRKDLFTE